jgi:hypothetical protein
MWIETSCLYCDETNDGRTDGEANGHTNYQIVNKNLTPRQKHWKINSEEQNFKGKIMIKLLIISFEKNLPEIYFPGKRSLGKNVMSSH